MKRNISLLLAVVLALGLFCGCGKDSRDNPLLDAKEKDSEILKSVEWTDGTIADGVYKNECLGMTFQIPEGWIQASAEETRSILNADPNDTATVYDVLLGPKDMSAIMAIVCLDLRQQIGGTSMTEDEILDEMKADMLEELPGASFSETEDFTLCGRKYRTAVLSAGMAGAGVTVSNRILFSRLGKDKLVMLTIRASTEEQLAYYMAHFTDDPSTIPAPPVEATPEPTARFTRGAYSGSSYTSEFLGLRFDLPEGWAFSTDQELAELMGLELQEEILGDPEAIAELFAQQEMIYDMEAGAADASAVVQLGLEDLSAVIAGSSLTAAEYADILVNQLRASGYSYEIGDLEQQELAGKTFTVVPAVLEDYGVHQFLYVAKMESYMLVITFTGTDASVRDYADCFTQF